MSFREYLHEKAEESRHNESVAYLMFLAGVMFFVGGMLETISLAKGILLGDPEWFFFIPYYAQAHPGAILGLAMIISGLSLMVFGIASGINYSRDRGWYMQELRKANSIEEAMMQGKTVKNAVKKKKVKA
jgi:VIT1/CCC1 family predicted Fe2+/Mn2+ transporter